MTKRQLQLQLQLEWEKKIYKIPSIYDKIKIKEDIKRETSFNESFIYKISKQKSPIKTIRYINNDTGRIRHFPPGAQEWFNSVYSYNKNYIKLLPVADKKVLKLLKSYFNQYAVDDIVQNNKKSKSKGMPYKDRKLSSNKVFVGKGDLKHTNKKIIITTYIYNAEQLYLKNKIKELYDELFSPKIKELTKTVNSFTVKNSTNLKEIIDYNRPHTMDEYLNFPSHPTQDINFPNHSSWHKNVCFRLFWKILVKLVGQEKILNIDLAVRKKIAKRNKYLKKGKNKKIFVSIKDKTKSIFLSAFLRNITVENIFTKHIYPLLELDDKNEEKDKNILKFKNEMDKIQIFYNDFDKYISLAEEFRIKFYEKFRYLLMVNKAKFEKPFIQKLTDLAQKLYNKQVEFNIVNIYKLHFNSDIYTQAVSLKLKNRNNQFFNVLTKSLTKAKLPNVSRLGERYHKENKNEYLINNIRNTYINTMLQGNTKENINIDPLNKLLIDFFPLTNNLKLNLKKNLTIIKQPVSLYKYVIRTLKHMKLAGVRVEAKGRLTRRFTAARSVFKVKWKGGLENVDSSFKGLSATMLRGDRKSNVEYSLFKSKNRNGAFGVKGWVGSK